MLIVSMTPSLLNDEDEVFVSQVAQKKVIEWIEFSDYPRGVDFVKFHSDKGGAEIFYIEIDGNPSAMTKWVVRNIKSIRKKTKKNITILTLFDGQILHKFPAKHGSGSIVIRLDKERGIVAIQALGNKH